MRFQVVSFLVLSVFSSAVFADVRPNIILLLADDQCKYSMGCYDTPHAKTPNLDQLAREGMIFDRHYDTTAICMASRATIMTGLYEYRTGCNFDSGHMLRSIWNQSYPVLLRDAGYKVAFAGKFGFEIIDQPGQRKGELPISDFDKWGGGPGQTSYETHRNESMKKYAEQYPHSTLSYGAFASDFVREATSGDGEAPFCLSISFKAPHHPTTPDPRFDQVFRGVEFEKPANYGREFGKHFSEQSRRGRQYERFHSWKYADRYDEVMATYYQQIYAIDQVVGMVRDALNKQGVAENTVIIYTSDNGFLCGSHGYGSKVLPYEESVCVPLIIHDPRHGASGKQLRCDSLTSNADFLPTILGLAGIEAHDEVDGRDLSVLLDNPNKKIHDYLPLINVWGPKAVHSFGVVSEREKLIYWPYAADGMTPRFELYDMQLDRLEVKNLNEEDPNSNQAERGKSTYANALEHWKLNCVQHHGYLRFASIFDPTVDWIEKDALYKQKK